MPSLSRQRIAREFARGDAAGTADERGQVLEDLVIYMFRRIPGVRFQEKRVLAANGSEELDLVFWNDRLANGLPFLPNVLVFECKNWVHPVGSPEVAIFRIKVGERALEAAILIAANGITGDAASRTAANNQIDTAFISEPRIKLIVLTRSELEALNSTEQLVRLIQDKISRIVMRIHML